jgi:hypothetical protein
MIKLLARFIKFGMLNFWQIEARCWKALYMQQRGGEAYNEMQRELADCRSELRRLKEQTK